MSTATLHELGLGSLIALDNGKVPAAWDAHLKRCLADCKDRPFDIKQARKVVLTLEVKPNMDDDGYLESVSTQFNVTSSIPKHKTKVYPLDVRQKSGETIAVFSEVSADGTPTMFDEQ